MFDGLALFLLLPAVHLPPALFQLPEGIGRVGLVLAVMAGFLLLETCCGRQSNRTPDARRSYRINLGTLLINDALFSLASASSLLILAERTSERGLLHGLANPWRAAAAFLLLDLTLYLWHRTCHHFGFLWRFHQAHHSDPFVNVTTAFRLHFVEVLLTTGVKAGFILVTGVEAAFVLASETVITLWIMFHHAHLNFPGERWLRWLFTVPSLHRMHHSVERRQHDRNFGLFLSLWDRLFGTLMAGEPVRTGLSSAPPRNWIELIRSAFRPLPPPVPLPLPPELIGRMIAEAAYYRAEKRGFAPGLELEDWVAAERQILARAETTPVHP